MESTGERVARIAYPLRLVKQFAGPLVGLVVVFAIVKRVHLFPLLFEVGLRPSQHRRRCKQDE